MVISSVHRRMPVIPFHSFHKKDSSALISSLLRLFAHHLALAVSALHPLKSGTLSLYVSVQTTEAFNACVRSLAVTIHKLFIFFAERHFTIYVSLTGTGCLLVPCGKVWIKLLYANFVVKVWNNKVYSHSSKDKYEIKCTITTN